MKIENALAYVSFGSGIDPPDYAEWLVRHAAAEPPRDTPLLIVRPTSDEASLLLSTGQFCSWVCSNIEPYALWLSGVTFVAIIALLLGRPQMDLRSPDWLATGVEAPWSWLWRCFL